MGNSPFVPGAGLPENQAEQAQQAQKKQNSGNPVIYGRWIAISIAVGLVALLTFYLDIGEAAAVWAAAAAIAVAAFTWTLSDSTGKLWTSGTNTLAEMGKQLDLAREEFIATHRPRLVVRGIGFAYNPEGNENEPEFVQFVIANVGETDATIVEAHAAVWTQEDETPQPPIPPYDDTPITNLADIKIRDGGIYVATYVPDCALWGRIEGLPGRPQMRVRFVGYIVYADSIHGPERGEYRMAFCRSYDYALGRFVREAPPDTDYEYGEGDPR